MHAIRDPRNAAALCLRRRVLAYAKCRWRARLRAGRRARTRCDDKQTDPERARLRGFTVHDSSRPKWRLHVDESTGRRPDGNRARPRLRVRDRRYDRPKRPSRLSRLRAARSDDPSGRPADASAAADAFAAAHGNTEHRSDGQRKPGTVKHTVRFRRPVASAQLNRALIVEENIERLDRAKARSAREVSVRQQIGAVGKRITVAGNGRVASSSRSRLRNA